MTVIVLPTFDLEAFLENSGIGRRTVELKAKQTFFSQGDVADCVYYLRKGRAKVTIVSNEGKEATITLLVPDDFVGEESLASVRRSASDHGDRASPRAVHSKLSAMR